jgi:uncharacterized protein (DUF1499 family)
MWLRRLALRLSLVAAALLLASGPGTRLGLWPSTAGILVLGVAGLIGLVATVLAIAGLSRARLRQQGIAALLVALLIGAASAAFPSMGLVRARSVPPIHDISTDTEHPPEFVALLPLRASAPNPPGYAGREAAEKQRQAYPDLQPLRLELAPASAFSKAHAAAEAMGWNIVAADAKAGRIEAVATTFWFGFKDDVVVRITPEGTGSRIDVRSKSRVGVSDVGTNAQRIRAYRERLK